MEKAPWVFSPTAGQEPIKLVKVTDEAMLFDVWPWLEPRLNVVKAKDKCGEGWNPVHVREAIVRSMRGMGQTELFLGARPDSRLEGFIVTTVRNDPWTQLPSALVAWILWANESLIELTLPQLKEIAKRKYIHRIEFFSGRSGWAAKASKFGFKPHTMSWKLEID